MEWTIEELDKLDKDITKLYLHSEMSEQSLADVTGKIDSKRYEINLANGVTTGDELVLPIQSVVGSACMYCGKKLTHTICDNCNKPNF